MGLLPAKKSAVHSSRTPLHGEMRILAKRNQPRFCESFPAKLFRKTESAFVFVLPSFSFWKSSVLRTEALQCNGCTTLVVLVIWILLEKHSNFVQQIPPLSTTLELYYNYYMKIESSVFKNNRNIPTEYTCYGRTYFKQRYTRRLVWKRAEALDLLVI